jgi:ribosomal protein L21E
MKTKAQKKISKVMTEYGKGELHSGSKTGKVVKSQKQAVAIALSEAGMSSNKRQRLQRSLKR